jgi:hypothetical protein
MFNNLIFFKLKPIEVLVGYFLRVLKTVHTIFRFEMVILLIIGDHLLVTFNMFTKPIINSNITSPLQVYVTLLNGRHSLIRPHFDGSGL